MGQCQSMLFSLIKGFFRAFSTSNTASQKQREIIYRIATPQQFPAIVDLMYQGFFVDEPMCKFLNLYDGKNRIKDCDDYTLAGLEQSLSMVAMDVETDEILGKKNNFQTRTKAKLKAVYFTTELMIFLFVTFQASKQMEWQSGLTMRHPLRRLSQGSKTKSGGQWSPLWSWPSSRTCKCLMNWIHNCLNCA